MNILFYSLVLVIMSIQPSQAAIEVYSGGKHFDTFEDYQKFDQKTSTVPLKMNDSVSQIQQPPVIKLDSGQQKLSKISYNNSVHHVMVNFEQNWKNHKPKFIVGADELQYAIEKAMKNQHEPTLLISDPEKLRILTYNAQENLSLKAKETDKTIKK